jgi:hypothetical protein
MPVLRRTYGDVYRDGKKRLRDSSPLNNFNSQGITKAYLDMMGIEMDRVYDTIDYVNRAGDPTRALGGDLDRTGLTVGESRTEAVVATDFTTTNFHFKIDPRLGWGVQKLIEQNYTPDERQILEDNGYITRTGSTIDSLIIPQSVNVSNTGGTIVYTTSAPAILTNRNNGYAPLVANSLGADSNVQSNVLISHALRNIPELRKIAHFIQCTNTFPIQNGSYALSDDEYRYNIATSKAAIPTNELAVRRAALSVPGVRDVLFQRHKYGNGTMHLILDGVSPIISVGLITAVTERVMQAASYADTVYVSAPEYLGVELTVYIETDPGITSDGYLREAAKNVIIQYINDLPLGGEIVWNQIVSDVVAIEGIKDFVPNVFKHGEYDPITKINSKQVILRFLNQKAKYNQKWYCDSGLCKVCS